MCGSWWRGRLYKIFVPSSSFSCKPKTALRKQSFLTKFVRNSNELYLLNLRPDSKTSNKAKDAVIW